MWGEETSPDGLGDEFVEDECSVLRSGLPVGMFRFSCPSLFKLRCQPTGGVARGGSASTNKVEILNGSRISGIVIGAYAAEKATDSNVTVVDSAVSGTLALFNGKNATTTYGSGTLTIKGNSDVTQAVLLPYMTSRADTDSSLSSYKGTTDTTLLLDGFNGGVQQLGDSLNRNA